jgi:hypothetical protein
VTGLWLDNWDSILGRGFFSCCHVQIDFGVHPTCYQMDTRALFPGLKWPGHESDHLRPSCAEVRSAWSSTSTLRASSCHGA